MIKHRILRFLPLLLSTAGVFLLLIAIGRGSGASLSYPDPTPELLAAQRVHVQSAKRSAAIGALLLFAGLTGFAIHARKKMRVASASNA
jgi:drug/metabolite transporter (DMT)-like permease